jgi:hypothetical protein
MPDFIYILRDPRTGDVKYVGKTKNPYFREKAHGSPTQVRKQGIHKIDWTAELRSLGLRPRFEIIEECPSGNWKEREEFWIAHYGLENLLNVRPCGTPGNLSPCSENAKEKLRRSVANQFADPIRREKHSRAMKEWATANPSACAKGGRIASQHPNFAAGRARFWSSMTPEQRAEFCKRRAAVQGSPVVTPEFIDTCKQAQKQAWSNESTRNARIAGIKAAWADPVKRAARIEKNKLARGAAA